MKTEYLYGIIGLLIGVIATFIFMDSQMPVAKTVPEVNEHANHDTMTDHASMSMNEMTTALEGVQGDAFDKAFIEMMIAHHQGAVDMAKQALEQAGHEEIKTLSTAIITAQEKEIAEMQSWYKAWGYSQ